MRITLDIPDAVYKKVKLKAAEEGVPLSALVTRALRREVAEQTSGSANRGRRVQKLFGALDKARNKKPVGRLNRDTLYDRSVLRRH